MLGLVVSCAGVSPHYSPILVTPHDQQSGRDWGGCLVGPKRRRGAIGIWNVAMRVYARIGRDDQCLADWSRASIQGIDGERQRVYLLIRQPTGSNLESTAMSRSLLRYPSDRRPGPSRQLSVGIPERHTIVEIRNM